MLSVAPREGAWLHTLPVQQPIAEQMLNTIHCSPLFMKAKTLSGFLSVSENRFSWRSSVKAKQQNRNFWKAGDTHGRHLWACVKCQSESSPVFFSSQARERSRTICATVKQQFHSFYLTDYFPLEEWADKMYKLESFEKILQSCPK